MQVSESTHKHRPRDFFRSLHVPPPPTSLLWIHLRFLTWKRRSASWAGQCCFHCRFSAVWWWPGWLCCDWSPSQGSPGLGCRQSQQMDASWPPGTDMKEWKSLNRCKRPSWQNPPRIPLLPVKVNTTDCTRGLAQTTHSMRVELFLLAERYLLMEEKQQQ